MIFLLRIMALFDQPNIPKVEAGESQIGIILQVLFVVSGTISVLMTAIAGLNYVLSNGDPQKTAKAKDTILYAVIGLVISILAFVIVTFVINKLFWASP